MTAKDYLGQYRVAEFRLRQIADQLEMLRCRMEGTTPSAMGDPVQGTPMGDKLAALMGGYLEQEEEVQAERERLLAKMREVRLAISDVSDFQQRALLEYRYLFGKSWEWIAEQLHFTRDYVRHQLHSKALKTVPISSPPTTY